MHETLSKRKREKGRKVERKEGRKKGRKEERKEERKDSLKKTSLNVRLFSNHRSDASTRNFHSTGIFYAH